MNNMIYNMFVSKKELIWMFRKDDDFRLRLKATDNVDIHFNDFGLTLIIDSKPDTLIVDDTEE